MFVIEMDIFQPVTNLYDYLRKQAEEKNVFFSVISVILSKLLIISEEQVKDSEGL